MLRVWGKRSRDRGGKGKREFSYYPNPSQEDLEKLECQNFDTNLYLIRGQSVPYKPARSRRPGHRQRKNNTPFPVGSEHWPELGTESSATAIVAPVSHAVGGETDRGNRVENCDRPIEDLAISPSGEDVDGGCKSRYETVEQNIHSRKPVIKKESPEHVVCIGPLQEMEHFVTEALNELQTRGILLDEDRTRLFHCPAEKRDEGPGALDKSSHKRGHQVNRFSYPTGPLVRLITHLIEEWVFAGTSLELNFPKYEYLDEGNGESRRKMVIDTVACHMMTLRSSWEGLENDLKKHKMVQLLTDLGRRGLLDLIGLRDTVGTQLIFPPTRDILESSFREQNKSTSKLTVGARALAKHCHRDETNNWWGNLTGSEHAKNENAEKVLKKILNNVGWLNIHQLPHALPILEVRNLEGYGARWSPDGTEFRGFLEPPMVAGWETGYRH